MFKKYIFWGPKLGLASVAVASQFCKSTMFSLLRVGSKTYKASVFCNDIGLRVYQVL